MYVAAIVASEVAHGCSSQGTIIVNQQAYNNLLRSGERARTRNCCIRPQCVGSAIASAR